MKNLTDDTAQESVTPPVAEATGLDDTNKKIISLLQKNGRRSYVSIAKEIGLSEAAVRLRVQRLTDDGVIQIVAVTNPMEMGFHRQAMVGITVNGDIEQVARDLRKISQIDYIIITAGRFDILAEVFASDDEALLRPLLENICYKNAHDMVCSHKEHKEHKEGLFTNGNQRKQR